MLITLPGPLATGRKSAFSSAPQHRRVSCPVAAAPARQRPDRVLSRGSGHASNLTVDGTIMRLTNPGAQSRVGYQPVAPTTAVPGRAKRLNQVLWPPRLVWARRARCSVIGETSIRYATCRRLLFLAAWKRWVPESERHLSTVSRRELADRLVTVLERKPTPTALTARLRLCGPDAGQHRGDDRRC